MVHGEYTIVESLKGRIYFANPVYQKSSMGHGPSTMDQKKPHAGNGTGL
jgi:hypothetical protein